MSNHFTALPSSQITQILDTPTNNHYDDYNYAASSYNDNNSDFYYYKADGTKAKVEDDKERK